MVADIMTFCVRLVAFWDRRNGGEERWM